MRAFTSVRFPFLCEVLQGELLRSRNVDVGQWHGTSTNGNPMLVTMEVPFVSFEMHVPVDIEHLQDLVEPNLPWAEDHFQERVSGKPMNPAPSHRWWPWAHGTHHDEREQFSHTYPERFWPKFANAGGIAKCTPGTNRRQISVPHIGIRFEYGDLGDVVEMLRDNPLTRQAYLPVFFPEDTGGSHRLDGARIPCSMGYHFMARGQELHCVYVMRSCDFVRHFRDDVYMAARLLQWLSEEMSIDQRRGTAQFLPGKLMVHISSLHAMEGDRPKMEGRT